MWAFLSRRFRTWVLFAVGMPVLAAVLQSVADRVEERQGKTQITKGLRSGAATLRRRSDPDRRRRGRRGRRRR